MAYRVILSCYSIRSGHVFRVAPFYWPEHCSKVNYESSQYILDMKRLRHLDYIDLFYHILIEKKIFEREHICSLIGLFRFFLSSSHQSSVSLIKLHSPGSNARVIRKNVRERRNERRGEKYFNGYEVKYR